MSQVIAKLVGGPAHGRRMVLQSLQFRIMIPELSKPPVKIQWEPSMDCQIVTHEYQLTNVEHKGVRYYKHSKLDAVKSKMLQNAFVNAKYEKWAENSLF